LRGKRRKGSEKREKLFSEGLWREKPERLKSSREQKGPDPT